MGDVGFVGFDRIDQNRQMIRKPEVVMIQIGDVVAPRLLHRLPVNVALIAEVLRQIDPPDAGVFEGGDDVGGLVRAAIADD